MADDTIYRRTQRAPRLAWLLGALTVAMVGVVLIGPPEPGWQVAAGLATMTGLLLATFTSLTVTVTARELQHHFGLGFWHKRYLLTHIVSVTAVRNRWWYGFGIRLTPHGWLYNLWGLDAVELVLAGGRRFRIGTDDPHTLVSTLRDAIARARCA